MPGIVGVTAALGRRVAVWCNGLQDVAVRHSVYCTTLHRTAPHCITLHHTATHGNTLHHPAPPCTTLHHTATYCNTGVGDVGHVAVSDAAALCVSRGPSFRDAPARSTHVPPCHALFSLGILKVCCSVLQCVAVCCSVLQRGAVCCSVVQCRAVCCSVLQCIPHTSRRAMWCSVWGY